jgi:hypothetical protein
MKTDNMMSRIAQILADNGIPANVSKINGHFEVIVDRTVNTVKHAPSLLESSFVYLNSTPGY